MSALEAIAYVSSAVGLPTEADLARLLERARAKNDELGVTGVLLHHDGTFFQYFEGPVEGVELVYERIRLDPMHGGIIELMRAPIKQRAFSDWKMGFTQAPRSTILKLSHANWLDMIADPHKLQSASEGVSLLVHFWQSSTGARHYP